MQHADHYISWWHEVYYFFWYLPARCCSTCFTAISLRSVNTENHEHLFEQARRSATAASNWHPQNVLYTVVMRLQAKAAFKCITDSQLQADSIVARADTDLPKYSGTFVY